MSFHNTSERYEYIYGNNARKLRTREDISEESVSAGGAQAPLKRRKYQEEPVRKPAAKRRRIKTKENASVQKNRARFLAFDWKYTVVTLLAVAICAAAAMCFLHAQAQLKVMENQIVELKTDKSSLLSEQTALESEIDKSINLDEIRTYAEKKLHMVYPKNSRIISYQGESSDYFRQYESVNASE